MSEKLKSFKELSTLQVDDYTAKRHQWRSVISRKNIKWFNEKNNVNNFDLTKSNKDIYDRIKSLFEDDKTRNFMIHIATNFLPLNTPSQCPILPSEKCYCKFSKQELTDVLRIKTGDRNKSMGYVGINSNVILSSDAIIELDRFVKENIINFDTQLGHIINHAFDTIRVKETGFQHKNK